MIRSFNNIAPQISENVFIDASAVVTGDVRLGKNASIWPCASIRGDLMPIVIGDNSNIQDNCVLHTTHASKFTPNGHALTIGKNVTVGHGAILHGCTIEDEVLIGMNAVILDGAVIEKHSVIGAGSIVGPGKIIKSGSVWYGNPVKKARDLKPKELMFFRYSAEKYIKLQEAHANI